MTTAEDSGDDDDDDNDDDNDDDDDIDDASHQHQHRLLTSNLIYISLTSHITQLPKPASEPKKDLKGYQKLNTPI